MRGKLSTAAVMGCVAVALTAGAAAAAPATSPAAHPIANTEQTFVDYYGDNESNTVSVLFTKNKWSFPGYSNEGTFRNTGESLTLKDTSFQYKGCKYKATYDASTTLYAGKFTCPADSIMAHSGTFTITTTGQTG